MSRLAIFLSLLLTYLSPTQADSSTYTPTNWIIDAKTLSNNEWSVQVTLADTSKICNIIAIGYRPQIVILPYNNIPEALKVTFAEIHHDTTSCYYNLNLKFDDDNTSHDYYKKIEYYMDEAFIESVELKVNKVRFYLPGVGLNSVADHTAITLDAATAQVSISEPHQSLLSNSKFMHDTNGIYLTTGHSKNILYSLTDSDSGINKSAITCSDSKPSSFSFIQEIDGYIYRRFNNEFQIIKIDENDGKFGSKFSNRPSPDDMMTGLFGSDCPVGIYMSPGFYLEHSIYLMGVFEGKVVVVNYFLGGG